MSFDEVRYRDYSLKKKEEEKQEGTPKENSTEIQVDPSSQTSGKPGEI